MFEPQKGLSVKRGDRGRARARGFFFSFFFFKDAVLGLVLGLIITLKQHSFKKKTDPNPCFTDNRQDLYVLHT